MTCSAACLPVQLDSFLRTSPVYFDPAKLSCFLMCLAPRDRARLLGMFIADKYSRTYEVGLVSRCG